MRTVDSGNGYGRIGAMATQLEEKLHTLRKEKRITAVQLRELLKAARDPWEAARGILWNRNIDPVRYQKQIRREWEHRTK